MNKKTIKYLPIIFSIISFVFILSLPTTSKAITFKDDEKVVQQEALDDNLIIFASEAEIANSINKDAIILADKKIRVKGDVNNNLVTLGKDVEINSTIRGDVFIVAENVRLGEKAMIDGQVYAASNTIYISPEAKLAKPYKHTDFDNWDYLKKNRLNSLVFSIAGMLLITLFIISTFPNFISKLPGIVKENRQSIALYGILGLFLTPIAIIVLFISVIGMPLGLILAGFYIFSLYLAKILSGILLGMWLAPKKWNIRLAGLGGVLILALISTNHFASSLINTVAILVGFGIIIFAIKNGKYTLEENNK